MAAGGFQGKQREDSLSKEGAPMRMKASEKGGTVTVGLISSTPGHAVQVAGPEILPFINHGLRQQECLPASPAACLHQPKQPGKVV